MFEEENLNNPLGQAAYLTAEGELQMTTPECDNTHDTRGRSRGTAIYLSTYNHTLGGSEEKSSGNQTKKK